MILIHARQHEFGSKEPRIRLWLNYDIPDLYKIVPLHDAEMFNCMINYLNLGCIKIHRSECDANKPCDCPIVADDETITKYLR